MFSLTLPFTDARLELSLPFPGWPLGLRYGLLVTAFAVIGYVLVRLYRHERRLVAAGVARVLLGLRLGVVAAVLVTLMFEPNLSRTIQEQVPGRVLIAIDRSDSMRVADPARPFADKQKLATALGFATAEELDNVPRMKLAERMLVPAGADVIAKLKEKHAVDLIGFDENPSELPLDPERLAKALDSDRGIAADTTADTQAFTDLKVPLTRASESAGDAAVADSLAANPRGKLVGVVVLTDGRHNLGESPMVKAAELAARKIPIFPVVMAPKDPPADVAIVSAAAQSATVFKGSSVPIEVGVRVTGWPAGPVKVTLELPPGEKGEKREPLVETIPHNGQDQTYQLPFKAKMDAPGPQAMTVTAESTAAKDRFPSNNTRTVRVNVVKDRARVMLLDGEARWEFHYLHTCLGRDPNMDVRSVVFRQPRITKQTDEELRKFGYPARKMPDDPDALTSYDCVVVGDVEPEQFGDLERMRLEQYVAEAGGTLVILAGKRAMPGGFVNDADPFRRLLPIKNAKPFEVKTGFQIAPTADGQRSWFLQMGDTGDDSRRAWARFPYHYWGVSGEPKDGAEVLATADGKPVIVRHNYGFGRVLFVGVDSTWRWRYKTGDYYHHRFWGQTAQWAASDRLLPTQNAAGTIRFGTREPTFRAGQDVEMIVRSTDAVRKLGATALKGARILKLPSKPGDAEKTSALTPLTHPDARPRDLTGKIRGLTPGKYAIELEIPEWADQLQGPPGPDGRATKLRSTFEMLPPDNEELVELSANLPLLEELAATTKGQVFTPDQAAELLEKLIAQTATVEHRVDRPFRKSWLTLIVILGLLSAEWGLRKWSGLP